MLMVLLCILYSCGVVFLYNVTKFIELLFGYNQRVVIALGYMYMNRSYSIWVLETDIIV